MKTTGVEESTKKGGIIENACVAELYILAILITH